MPKPMSFTYVMMPIFMSPKSLENQQTRTVTASDFVYSFDRIRDKTIASPGQWTLESVKSYEAIDDHTLKIELTNPFSPFLGILSMKYLSVLPKELGDNPQSSIGVKPIGTGPFYVKGMDAKPQNGTAKTSLVF